MGANEDGRPFRPGRSSLRVRNPGLACHERGRARAIHGISIISALVRRTGSLRMSGLRRSYSQNAIVSLASFLIDP